MRTRRAHGPWQKPGPSRLAHERAGAGPAPADRVAVTRRIAAPVCAIFCLVYDLARHIDIDGSGMLQAGPAPGRSPRRARNSTWTWTAASGRHRHMAEYQVRCTITQLIRVCAGSNPAGDAARDSIST
jgi:hypothetical protein